MNTRKNVVIVAVLAALLGTVGWSAFVGNGDEYEQSIKWGDDLAWSPEGIWVLSTPTPMGNIIMLHNNHAQDLGGTRFGGTLLFVNENPTSFGAFPDVEKSAGWITQTIRTGPTTFATTMVGYGTKRNENAPDTWLYVDVISSTWQTTGPDTKEGEATIATYLASQDADGDGLPDEGQEPVSCVPFTFTGRRLRAVPSCMPAPIPE